MSLQHINPLRIILSNMENINLEKTQRMTTSIEDGFYILYFPVTVMVIEILLTEIATNINGQEMIW